MNKRAVALLVSAAMLLPVAAKAACVQADLAGAWQLYLQSDQGSRHCALTIGKFGSIAKTNCAVIGDPSPLLLDGGKFTIGKFCDFSGAFKTGDLHNRVRHGTLSSDKRTAAGIGSMDGEFFAAFTFSMIKLPDR